MNLINLLTLTIRVEDYNLVADRSGFLQQLRKLTLHPYSGMNCELNRFERVRKTRPVDVKILTAYRNEQLVAWAIMSREPSDFDFLNTGSFHSGDGILFEVFVDPKFRKQGIGSELIKDARRRANGTRLCVCPHDSVSEKFFNNFKNFKNKEM